MYSGFSPLPFCYPLLSTYGYIHQMLTHNYKFIAQLLSGKFDFLSVIHVCTSVCVFFFFSSSLRVYGCLHIYREYAMMPRWRRQWFLYVQLVVNAVRFRRSTSYHIRTTCKTKTHSLHILASSWLLQANV